MIDIKQLLDGTVEDVKSRLAGLDAETLAAARATEQADKNRKGVTDAIELAQTAASVQYTSTTDRGDAETATTVSDVSAPVAALTTAASLDRSGDANIGPATEFDPAGAPMQTSDFDMGHPALDANPRANTSADQNRIDFNDPMIEGHEAVAKNLAV